MVQAVAERGAAGETGLLRDAYLKAFRFMLLARLMDDKFASLYRSSQIQGGVFLGRGQEALSASVGVNLRQGDIFAPLIRDAAGRFAFGESILDSVRTYLGSPLGPMRARDGNVHRGNPRKGCLPMISHLGAMISVANGALLAHRFKGIHGTVAAASIGDGGTSTGAFHEAMNQAAVEKLPLVLVVANNQYAYSTPNDREFACEHLLDRAAGYGIAGSQVEGNDLQACLAVLGAAIERARAGRGPQMIVARLLRLCGHGEHDDASYVDPNLKNSAFGRDCLKVAEENLLLSGWADPKALAEMRDDARAQIEEAVATVQHEPAPDPYREDWSALSSTHLLEGQEDK